MDSRFTKLSVAVIAVLVLVVATSQVWGRDTEATTDPPQVAEGPSQGTRSGSPSSSVSYPEARGYAQMVSIGPAGQMVLFGGESNRRTQFEETWTFDAQSRVWSQVDVASHPSNAGGSSSAYDSESDRVIFHFTSRLDASGPNGHRRISETWAYSPSDETWTEMSPEEAPFGLMGARMVYDKDADRVILFGGADFTDDAAPRFNETWAYDFNSNTWTQRHPAESPPGRSYYGIAYDERADKTLIFAGSFEADARDRAAELWAYDYDSNTWAELTYEGAPPADHHPFMVYAPGLDRTLYLVNRAFWAFDSSTRSWTELSAAESLGIRHFHAMAYDSEGQQLVVFGGGPRGMRYDNGTWIYTPESSTWEALDPNG